MFGAYMGQNIPSMTGVAPISVPQKGREWEFGHFLKFLYLEYHGELGTETFTNQFGGKSYVKSSPGADVLILHLDKVMDPKPQKGPKFEKKTSGFT